MLTEPAACVIGRVPLAAGSTAGEAAPPPPRPRFGRPRVFSSFAFFLLLDRRVGLRARRTSRDNRRMDGGDQTATAGPGERERAWPSATTPTSSRIRRARGRRVRHAVNPRARPRACALNPAPRGRDALASRRQPREKNRPSIATIDDRATTRSDANSRPKAFVNHAPTSSYRTPPAIMLCPSA